MVPFLISVKQSVRPNGLQISCARARPRVGSAPGLSVALNQLGDPFNGLYRGLMIL